MLCSKCTESVQMKSAFCPILNNVTNLKEHLRLRYVNDILTIFAT